MGRPWARPDPEATARPRLGPKDSPPQVSRHNRRGRSQAHRLYKLVLRNTPPHQRMFVSFRARKRAGMSWGRGRESAALRQAEHPSRSIGTLGFRPPRLPFHCTLEPRRGHNRKIAPPSRQAFDRRCSSHLRPSTYSLRPRSCSPCRCREPRRARCSSRSPSHKPLRTHLPEADSS